MKRFIAALFAVSAFAQDETTTEDATAAAEDAETTASDVADGVADWLSSRQDAVEFTTIESGSDCKLGGNYQGFKNVGLNGVSIRNTVSDCDIPEGAIVLTWNEIEDPDTPGNLEGFYCYIEFSQSNASAMASADVETQTGTGVDYDDWDTIPRTQWCDGVTADPEGEVPDCERQSTKSTWQKMISDAQTNYPIDYNTATSKGTATCSAYRLLSTPNNYMEIKYDVPYTVTSGYKIYANQADFDAGTVQWSGDGNSGEFTFMNASALAATAILLSATLLA